VHASDGSDPFASGKAYEYARRNYGLTASGRTGCAIRGIETRRNMHNDGSLVLGYHSTVTDCLASQGSLHSVFVQPGCHLVNVVADGAGSYHPSGISLFIWNPAGNGEDMTFEGCQALLPVFTAGVGGGFGGHGSGQLGTITYRNCIAQNCDLAFSTDLFQHAVLEGCSIVGNCTYGLDLSAPDATISNWHVDSVRIRLITIYTPDTHLTITGLNAASTNGAMGIYDPDKANLNLTLTDSAMSGLTPIALMAAGGQLTFLRNQIPSGPYYLFYLSVAPAAMNSDYNAVYAGGHVQWGTVEYGWAAYKAATAQDTHSTP
jgi:hypothetical protein